MPNKMKISLKNSKITKTFDIDIDKLTYVLSRLEGKKLKYTNQKQIENLLEKYNLFDRYFLENINKI